MMENKQTAIDWLVKQVKLGDKSFDEFFRGEIEQAKQMEKEQIIDAYSYGFWRGNNDDDFEPEEYYDNPYCNPDNKYYGK
jgi:hypothetical protein